MTRNSKKLKTLPNPSPSSPTNPPKYHTYFTIRHHGEDIQFFTQAWTQAYAAANIVQRITKSLGEPRWLDSHTIIYEKGDHQLIIKETRLEDLVEYELSPEEEAWNPPIPYSSQMNRALAFSDQELIPSSPTDTSEPEEKPEKPKPVTRRHKKTKPAPEGQTTIPQLSEEFNIQPNKARQILRKNNIKKPTNGWTFDNKDPILTTIRELFQRHSS